jgi:hypothetical protein
VCYKSGNDEQNNNKEKRKNKTITEYRIPDRKENDLIFAVYQNMKMPNPDGIYDDIAKSFAKTLDRMGKGEREDRNENRRQITLHSFRRFVTSQSILLDFLVLHIGELKYFGFLLYAIKSSKSEYHMLASSFSFGLSMLSKFNGNVMYEKSSGKHCNAFCNEYSCLILSHLSSEIILLPFQ